MLTFGLSLQAVRSVCSKAFSTSLTALKGLSDNGIVSEYGDSRQISDILFLLWLRQRN